MKKSALQFLRTATQNPNAEFREGQWESIQAAVEGQKTLVVQCTGWGKSMVYFIATKLLRNQGRGPTLLLSPLLSLMRNQVEAAERIGIRAATINSTNLEEWKKIESEVKNNAIDVLLISPERLGNPEFLTNVLPSMSTSIGMLVVDEAHCISDWGHDFRPDYQRIVRVLKLLPPNVSVIATTATANNRVIDDVTQQLGNLQIVRGGLNRKSLKLQNIVMPSPAARLAWLATTIPKLNGSGIVYVLTKRDADKVTTWLQSKDISAAAYYSGVESREELEQQLLDNELKVVVATVALGMGFDKRDLEFVIHYQRPSSVVHYYQQVGRAGRALDTAIGILLHGEEDDQIAEYFFKSAFPPQYHVMGVLNLIQKHNGLSIPEMESKINLRKGQIEKAIKFMSFESPSPITKDKTKWYANATALGYKIDEARIESILEIRQAEQKEMQSYMACDDCLMRFLANALDDAMTEDCGRCANCVGNTLVDVDIDQDLANQAAIFLRRSYQPIKPRARWPAGPALPIFGFSGNINPNLRAEEGRTLCLWGDDGWGKLVQQGKYVTGKFDGTLVQACTEMIAEWKPVPFPTWVTCVPSKNRPELVPGFAQRLADDLGIPFVPCIIKTRPTQPQKEMQNSFRQANNLDGAFAIEEETILVEPCLLVDDMVDSGWTMTVLAALLRRAGVDKIHPLGLALNSLGTD